MASELSERLMDAYVTGDAQEIERIRNEIRSREDRLRPKRDTTTIKINTVLSNDMAPASQVYHFLNKAFGDDWWEWEMETIERMLWIRYGIALEDANRDKVWSVRHVCRSDKCFSDWFDFNQVAISFGSGIADFEYLRKPSPGMVISTVKTLNEIRPDREGFFGNDVINYICILLIDDGVYTPPPSLVFVIRQKMEKMVSPTMKKNWLTILRRYNQIVKKVKPEIQETEVDIQAKRLVNAEAAALVYG